MTSVTTASPVSSDDTTSIDTAMSSTVRFGKRSAATPPHGVAISMAMPNASITPPSPALLPVRSLASQPRATDWPITPKITTAALMKSRRKPSDSITECESSDPRVGRSVRLGIGARVRSHR